VVVIKTEHSPEELLKKIHAIEKEFGRERKTENYTSREMDIDILYYDDIYMETESLIIPHSRIHQRKFVLVPLTEIAPEFKHPLLRLTSWQMLDSCRDSSIIIKVE
jgi:2-amino-4-hydroxy-6-hydroxymethyldihydropteridine diphosphokinase